MRAVARPRLTDDQARLVETHAWIVWMVLKRQRVGEYRRDDAYQDGQVGLIYAAQGWDPGRGLAFSTYAVVFVAGEIIRGSCRFDGINQRRAQLAGERYRPPGALDDQVAVALLDPSAGPEHVALQRALLEDVTAAMADWAETPLDRTILLELATPSERSWLSRDAAVARRHGTNRETVRKRRLWFQARLAARAAA